MPFGALLKNLLGDALSLKYDLTLEQFDLKIGQIFTIFIF